MTGFAADRSSSGQDRV